MNQIRFGDDSSGCQVGVNHGVIHISFDRTEPAQQRVDDEILRSLAFPQMLDRRENVEPCHTNTCQWILDLEAYQSWRSGSRGLLWIKGKPGAGKSTLMSFLHGELNSSQNRNHGIKLGFFFTAQGAEMQRTPRGMLRYLLHQIFDRDTTVRPQIREIYKQRYRHGEWEWPQGVLEELLAGVILASASRQQVAIFVDALDETGAESAQQLAAYFNRLLDRAAKNNAAIRICISCRHYPIIGSVQAQAMEICVEQHNHRDIATYINDMLDEIDVDPSEDMKQMLMEQLIQQANGVFQWVRLIMPLIMPLIRQRILEGESFDDIYYWLFKGLPAKLEDAYMSILNDMIEVRNLEQSFLLFQWVCLAKRPLTMIEMRYALVGNNAQITRTPKTWEKTYGFVESDERMERRIKALSGGLVQVVPSEASNKTVQAIHQSVNEFLRAKGLAALSNKIRASCLK